MSKEEEKVKALGKEDCKAEYAAIEAISLRFERQKKGYRHSPYLCYVAAKVAASKSKRIPFTFGMGQGKTWVAILLAEWHA